MARTVICGFELGNLVSEGNITGSGPVIESSIVRSGSFSLKVAAVSGSTGRIDLLQSDSLTSYQRFYLRITARPATTRRQLFGAQNATPSNLHLLLEPTGALTLKSASGIGTSTTLLTDTNRWYLIELIANDAVANEELRIDGNTEVSFAHSIGTLGAGRGFGTSDTVADTYTAYYDDFASDAADWCGPGAVVMVKPAADSAGGTGWTLGTGTALGGNGFGSVDNTPPTGVADLAVGSDPKQIRNAASAANSNYDATMQTYLAAGVNGKVNAVLPVIATAAPVTTSSKQGTVGVVSNPAITNIALSTNGTAGAFWSGTAAGAFPTGWKISYGTMTAAPSVALGTAPVMRVTQVTASTRIAMVCFMGIYVDFTPAPVTIREPSAFQRAQVIGQAVNRASSF